VCVYAWFCSCCRRAPVYGIVIQNSPCHDYLQGCFLWPSRFLAIMVSFSMCSHMLVSHLHNCRSSKELTSSIYGALTDSLASPTGISLSIRDHSCRSANFITWAQQIFNLWDFLSLLSTHHNAVHLWVSFMFFACVLCATEY
jgi:hypothetical protein